MHLFDSESFDFSTRQADANPRLPPFSDPDASLYLQDQQRDHDLVGAPSRVLENP